MRISILILLILISLSLKCQDMTFKNSITHNNYDTACSFFQLTDSYLKYINTTFKNKFLSLYPNTYNLIIKKTERVLYDFQVDGADISFDFELYQRKMDSISLFTQFSIKEDNAEIILSNRPIIKARTSGRGGLDYEVFKLIDIEDQIPFLIYNYESYCYKLRSDKEIRWISLYQDSKTGVTKPWEYESRQKEITINTTKYFRIWTIIYSNEDNIFEIIDMYAIGNNNLDSKLENVELSGFKNGSLFLQIPKFIMLTGNNEGFKNFYIDLTIDSKTYSIPVNNDIINIENISIENIVLKRREVNKTR